MVTCVQDDYYRVSVEALDTTSALVAVLRSLPPSCENLSDLKLSMALSLYQAVYLRAASNDVDQEVKESAITCLCNFCYYLADALRLQGLLDDQVLPLLADRMKNETTWLVTVRKFTLVAQSPFKIDLSRVVREIVSNLIVFLRKNMRSLRLASLELLVILLETYVMM